MKKGTIIQKGKDYFVHFIKSQFKESDYLIQPELGMENIETYLTKEVEFEEEGGVVSKLKIANQLFEKGKKISIDLKKGIKEGINNLDELNDNEMPMQDYANAPYNFIPINDLIIYANDSKVDHSIYEGLSGYIDLEAEALTPLFIRGKNENFFTIKDQYVIPGSSFRGLIKTLCQILSFSKFSDYDDSRFYFRAIAAQNAHSIRNHYYERMGLAKEKGDLVTHNSHVGFLNYDKIEDQYFIYQSTGSVSQFEKGENDKAFEFKIIKEGSFYKVYSGKMISNKRDKKHWRIENKCDKKIKLEIDRHIIDGFIRDKMKKINIDILSLARNNSGEKKEYENGVPIFFTLNSNKVDSIGHTKNYRLPYRKTIKEIVYSCDESKHDYVELLFGITGENSLAGKLQFEDLVCKLNIDETKVIYEIPKTLSSPKPTSFQLYLEQNGNPKSYNKKKSEIKHYDSEDVKIRGFKQYWHRNNSELTNEKISWYSYNFEINKNASSGVFNKLNLEENTDYEVIFFDNTKTKNFTNFKSIKLKIPYSKLSNEAKSLFKPIFYSENQGLTQPQSAPIKALGTNTKFSGKIRFDNLTNEELGLLLTAIDLPPECAHKIGMGKPLGLGSIRVTPTLKMINRKLRYNPLSIDNDSKEDPSEVDYKKEFAAILYSALDQKHSDIWQIDRLSKLKAMLTFNDTIKTEKWIKGTNYMDFAEDKDKYLNRHVLPNPLEVIELNK